MTMEKFVARDSKSALEKVRAKLGPDALVLLTERGDLGVEVSAVGAEGAGHYSASDVQTPLDESVNEITLGYLDRELKSLREVLYNALGERAWQDLAGKKPVLAALEQRLRTLGLSKPIIDLVTSTTDVSSGLNDAWAATLMSVTLRIDSAGQSSTRMNEAPKAVIGGSIGCRSVICQQLIKESLQVHKSSQILLLSATQDPSGALVDFCRREKVKRIQASTVSEARECLKRVKRGKKVIVETDELRPSLGISDPVLELLGDRELGFDVISILPATYQSEILRSIDHHIVDLPIVGAVISQISEAVSLGPVIDVLISGEIPLIGVSQQADKFLRKETPSGLIRRAKRLAKARLEGSETALPMPSYSRTA